MGCKVEVQGRFEDAARRHGYSVPLPDSHAPTRAPGVLCQLVGNTLHKATALRRGRSWGREEERAGKVLISLTRAGKCPPSRSYKSYSYLASAPGCLG